MALCMKQCSLPKALPYWVQSYAPAPCVHTMVFGSVGNHHLRSESVYSSHCDLFCATVLAKWVLYKFSFLQFCCRATLVSRERLHFTSAELVWSFHGIVILACRGDKPCVSRGFECGLGNRVRVLLFLMVPFALPRAALGLLHPMRPNWRWDLPTWYISTIWRNYLFHLTYILYHIFVIFAKFIKLSFSIALEFFYLTHTNLHRHRC